MTVSTKKTVKKASPAKATTTKKKAAPKKATASAPVKKASKAKAAPADKPVEKKERLTQVLPGTGDIRVAILKGKKEIDSVELPPKAVATLYALQSHKGKEVPKAELFATIVKLFGIKTSQDGFRVNEQCKALKAAKLATMQKIEGGGAAQYRAATERGMQADVKSVLTSIRVG